MPNTWFFSEVLATELKQIGIIAERMFDKNRTTFMSVYTKETEKPYGYLLVDHK